MMGGRIWVESVDGQGSTFHFTARFGCSERDHRRRSRRHVRPLGADRRRQCDQSPDSRGAHARLGHDAAERGGRPVGTDRDPPRRQIRESVRPGAARRPHAGSRRLRRRRAHQEGSGLGVRLADHADVGRRARRVGTLPRARRRRLLDEAGRGIGSPPCDRDRDQQHVAPAASDAARTEASTGGAGCRELAGRHRRSRPPNGAGACRRHRAARAPGRRGRARRSRRRPAAPTAARRGQSREPHDRHPHAQQARPHRRRPSRTAPWPSRSPRPRPSTSSSWTSRCRS